MSDVKFACPYCLQHIGCDAGYCGERIDCPGCGQEIFIPQRSTFVPLHSAGVNLALPVASRGHPTSRPATLDVWTADKWEQHAKAKGTCTPSRLLPLWILLLLPFVVALVLIMHGVKAQDTGYVFGLSALLAGFYWCLVQHKTGLEMVLKGLVYSFAILFLFGILGTGLLFFGCVLALGGGMLH
jgi:hypothetical protein